MIQAVKRTAALAAEAAERTGFLDLLERTATPGGLVHVLTYHRVAFAQDDPSLDPVLISATPPDFEHQMAMLVKRHCVVSMEEVLDAARTGAPLPPGAVLLTFDDAYRDFREYAWPVIERFGLPATIFVPTDYPDRSQRVFWWDRLYESVCSTTRLDVLERAVPGSFAGGADDRKSAMRALRTHVKSLPHTEAMSFVDRICEELGAPEPRSAVLGWDELRELSERGIALCPHTRHHPLLTRISPSEVRAEVRGSRLDLERELGHSAPVFAYPSGAWDDAAVDAVEKEGIELAFTTRRGVVDLRRHHPLRLPRIPVNARVTPSALRVQLLPQFAHLNAIWAS